MSKVFKNVFIQYLIENVQGCYQFGKLTCTTGKIRRVREITAFDIAQTTDNYIIWVRMYY